MLLRNLSINGGLCNGTRLIIEDVINDRLIRAKIATGECKGKTVLIPKIITQPADETAFGFEWRRLQFPIRLAFCFMFINHKAKHCQKLQCGFKSHVSATASFMLQHREWVIRTTSNFFFQEEKINLILLPTMLFIKSSFNRCFLPTITARSANAIQVLYTDCHLC